MFKKVHLTLTALLCATLGFAQSGSIKVHMFDDKKQPIPFANVVAYKHGTQVQAGGGVTDMDGYCTITPLDPGEYDVKGVEVGFPDKQITGVTVTPNVVTYVDLAMSSQAKTLGTVTVTYTKDIVPPNTIQGQTIDKKEYDRLPEKDINGVVAQTAGVHEDGGGKLYFRGARNSGTEYIVDGVKVSSTDIFGNSTVPGVPQSMVGEVNTVTGGIPAKYGDVTGGIVEINTLGASPKFFGSVQGITSEGLDAFGYNDINFSVGGPILSKKDTVNHGKIPVVDFILGGEYTHKKDADPSFFGGYSVNSTVLSQIEQNPFVINPAGGYQNSADYVSSSDINHTKYRPNIPSQSISLNGKLGFHVNDNVNITAGGTYEYDNSRYYIDVYELFNSAQNPLNIHTSWSGYVRLTQRFPTPPTKDKKEPLIKNAYYTVQAEYGNTYDVLENYYLKDNLFAYGYVGKFNQYFSNVYARSNGSMGDAYYQTGFADSLYTFTPGSYNPLEANYTTQLYSLIGAQNITNSNILQENGAMLNGSRPFNVYSLWYNTGRAYGGLGKSNNNHLRFTADFSADIKHNSIQIGFEYEQNVFSYYSITAVDLWNIMRQNANLQLQQLDVSNPILVEQGTYNHYEYNRLYNGSVQSQFDKSMREKLGLAVNSTDYIQPDNYDPSFFSLDMFSASDLLNNGSSIVTYYGYNYLGNKGNSNPSIDDFFNAVDANGNHTYPVAPYHPIYMAGYIQDHFDIKSLKFDVGLRVDRYDANQPVLSDPYLLFPAKKVSEIPNTPLEGKQTIPSNIGGNYVVYVNDAQNPTSIVGYRNGNTWYNAQGSEIPDPSVLASATTTGNIQPYLENPSQTTVSSNAFTTYTPQINVMPRVSFSFPITDMANFFAHYDVLTQRPSLNTDGTASPIPLNIFDPVSYMYIQNLIGSVLYNPNLLPTQTIDYELGFTQVLNERRSAALTISAFYRENRNEIQTYRYLDAYPVSYMAFSNIDFGTTKGLSISYLLRTTGNVQFRANYTLQFATGTGSGPTSGINLASSGEPNLQIPQPLDYDQRHSFNLDMDYHYASGKNYNGPVITTKSGKAIQVLADAGFNINLTAGSGTPYTRQSNATEAVGIGIQQHVNLVGSINGAYMPWQYRVDMRVDKDFPFKMMKSKKDKALKCDVLVYLQALNVLNTQNVLNVYHYTGSASDDGYLSSLAGQQYIAQQASPQAFQDQYKIKEQQAGYLATPRQLRLGVEFNF